jgi:hypothetical protein
MQIKPINIVLIVVTVFLIASGIGAAGEFIFGWTRLRPIWVSLFAVAFLGPWILGLFAIIYLIVEKNLNSRNQ